jgi:hypothetical protein
MRLPLLACLLALPCFAQPGVYRFTVDQDQLSGAVDFSALNHPIAAADRVVVRNGHFSTVAGRRVRFFGMNLAFGANFPAEADAPRIAKRLRRLGVNLVRLHHMDSNPDRDPASANSTLTTAAYPTLNPVSIARLRRFLDALRAEGIYANLNVHVGYRFRPEIDGVPPLPGMDMPTQSKPLHVYYPRMVELQEQYARKLIDALKLKNDPVLAMVEIDNETSLLHGWMTGALDRYAVGEYREELRKQWREYTHVEVEPVAATDKDNPRRNDWLLFLAGRDRAYLDRMKRAVHEAADMLVPVTGTQMGYGGLLNLDSHASMDFQDNHFYIDHYNFPHQSWDTHDWRMRDSSSVGSGLATFLNMAAGRVAGMPYTVSEFNQPWPNRQAAEIDATLAAFGAFQDWDAIVHFAYEHGRNWETQVPSGFNVNGDWTKFPNIGQSALLFRGGVIQPGEAPVVIPVSRELQLQFGRERKPGAIAPFLGANGFDPATALLHPVALRAQEKPTPQTSPIAAPYRSDTKELLYDPRAKVFTIQSARAAGVIGFVGTNQTAAGPLVVQLAPSARGFATIVVTSLDERPIVDSARLLLTTPGYTLGTVPGTTPPAMQKIVPYPGTTDWWTVEHEPASADRPSGRNSGGVPPVWMERVESTIVLKSSAKALSVYPLDGAGKRLKAVPAAKTEGGFRIHLQADGQDFAPWYEIVRN